MGRLLPSPPSTAATPFAKPCSGSIYDWGSWTPLLVPRFARAGAYFIPNDAFDWSQDIGDRFVPAEGPALDGPDAWHPNDELFVPLEHSDGRIVGIMSFGDPLDGRRPDDERLAVAVRSRLPRRPGA